MPDGGGNLAPDRTVSGDAPPDTRVTIRERLVREVQELERVGREYQIQASVLLRSGRPGGDAWFDAGLELKRTAQRLRELGRLLDQQARTAAPQSANSTDPRLIRRVASSYPYASR